MNRFFLSLILSSFLIIGSSSIASAATLPTLNLDLNGKTEVVPNATVESWVTLDTRTVLGSKTLSEIENTGYCPVSYSFCDLAMQSKKRLFVHTELTTDIDKAKIATFLSELALRTDSDPKDAVFSGTEDGTITVSQKEIYGYAMKQDVALTVLTEALQNSNHSPLIVSLPGALTEPKIKSADIDKLGVKELIGTGTTNFKGSPKNRIYNIKRALEQFQSIIIAPNEEFSFVHYLGEVDGEHGYLPELVIRNNKTEPEFGGGICQVSSTVFRAAIYSGMKITERRNHSYPVQYYKPYGLDATVYVPKPDFRFQNNTGHHIMMQSEIVGDTLNFRFFGTDDGRTTTLDGPHILSRGGDGSMKTIFTQIVKDKDGQEMIKDSFASNYKSPSLFPHPGEEQKKLTSKPNDWSSRQWREYKKLNP
ncbi:MAG: VanW family protein [Patescibacteria group bacterium]